MTIVLTYMYILQVEFWAQHASFILVGVIVVTSVRGLLITLTKVSKHHLHCVSPSKNC